MLRHPPRVSCWRRPPTSGDPGFRVRVLEVGRQGFSIGLFCSWYRAS